MRRASICWLGFMVLVTALVTITPATVQAQGTQAAAAVKPEALVGTYQGTATSPSGDVAVSATLKYEKNVFGGTINAGQGGTFAITGGSVTPENKLVLTFDMSGTTGTISCTVKDDSHLEGSWTMGDANGTVTLAKVPADAAKAEPAKPEAPGAAASATGAKPAAPAGDPLTGQWDGVTGNSEMSVPFTMNLKLDGEKVTGDISSEQGGAPFSTGTWKNGALNLSFELGGMGTVTMAGAIQEGKLVGSLDVGGQMQMQWAAVKK